MKDLQESQSKLINTRWIGFVATENESSLGEFRAKVAAAASSRRHRRD